MLHSPARLLGRRKGYVLHTPYFLSARDLQQQRPRPRPRQTRGDIEISEADKAAAARPGPAQRGFTPETFAGGRDRYTVEGFAGKKEVSAEYHRDRRNRDDRNPNSLRRKVERKKGTCLQVPVSGWGKGSWFSCNRGSCFKQGRSSVPHSHALRKGRRRVTCLFITHIVDVRRVVARWFYVLLRRRCFHHHASSATGGQTYDNRITHEENSSGGAIHKPKNRCTAR